MLGFLGLSILGETEAQLYRTKTEGLLFTLIAPMSRRSIGR